MTEKEQRLADCKSEYRFNDTMAQRAFVENDTWNYEYYSDLAHVWANEGIRLANELGVKWNE